MRSSKTTYVLLVVVGIVAVAALLAVSPDRRGAEPLLLYTEIHAANGTVDWQYPERSRVVAVDPAGPGEAQVLTSDFISARSPAVSFDGRRLLFAGRKTADDPWGIWELPLDGGDARLLTPGMEGCTDPSYLPDNQITFSALAPVDADDPQAHRSLALFTAGTDGCCVQRISFHPDADVGATVLRDSRVLFAATTDDASRYLAMRYDGTGMDLYYESSRGGHVMRRPYQTEEGELVFVETDSRSADGGRLVAVRDTRPLHSYRDLAPGSTSFHSAFPSIDGRWVVSKRQSSDETFALFAFDPETGEEMQLTYAPTMDVQIIRELAQNTIRAATGSRSVRTTTPSSRSWPSSTSSPTASSALPMPLARGRCTASTSTCRPFRHMRTPGEVRFSACRT